MAKPTIGKTTANTAKNLLEELQASLVQRFSRAPLAPDPVVYEFTNDRALLHQYYRLRESMYRKVFHTDKFVGAEDVHDKISHILIARRGKLVVGGCRLTIREADEDFLLPMESQEFRLRDMFSSLPLNKVRHGEISRFAVIDEDEDHLDIMLVLSQLIIEKCVDSDLNFVFLKSSLPMARHWRKIIQTHCGQSGVRIRTDIAVPENPIHPEVKWYITEVPLPASQTPLSYEGALVRPIESLVH